MKRRAASLAMSIALVAAWLLPSALRAETRVQIDEMYPAGGSTLAPNQSFYVRLAYMSDEAVNLWARPYFRGDEVRDAASNSSEKFTGSGEALGWFALTNAGEVDEVRVRAGGGTPYREWVVASVPVTLHWASGASAPALAPPPWVAGLQSTTAARSAGRAKEAASKPVPATDVVVFNGFMLTMIVVGLAGIIVPLWSFWKWRGIWRIAAGIPVAVVIVVLLRIVFDTSRDPTSHNLWPFEVLMWSAMALVAVWVLKMARKFVGETP
jgi:hypothetical protein